MHAIKTLVKDEHDYLSYSSSNPLRLAEMALKMGDSKAAQEYWKNAWGRHQSYVKTAPQTLHVLRGLKLFQEAESIMLEGIRRDPSAARYSEGYALVAEHSGRLTEAVARWEATRKSFPTSWTAYFNPGRCMIELGKLDAADNLLARAVAKFSDRIDGWITYARVAEARRDWNIAKSRWRAVNERFSHAIGVLGQVGAMIKLGEVDEAEKFLDEVRTSLPTHPELAAELAYIAENRNDAGLAVERWSFVRQRFPQFLDGYKQSARLLRSLGKVEDYRALLHKLEARFPGENIGINRCLDVDADEGQNHPPPSCQA